MELEFESGAVQWCGCLVHRADTELGRERERESPAPAAIHSVANYTAPPPLTPVAMAGGRGSVLFWDGSDGGCHLSSSPPPPPSVPTHLPGERATRSCLHSAVAISPRRAPYLMMGVLMDTSTSKSNRYLCMSASLVHRCRFNISFPFK